MRAHKVPKPACSARFGPDRRTKYTPGASLAPLFGQFQGEVRLGPGPMGQEFSGNCDVTSRNALLHNGATNATRSQLSDPYEVSPGRARGSGAELGGPLATVNFRELLFHALG